MRFKSVLWLAVAACSSTPAGGESSDPSSAGSDTGGASSDASEGGLEDMCVGIVVDRSRDETGGDETGGDETGEDDTSDDGTGDGGDGDDTWGTGDDDTGGDDTGDTGGDTSDTGDTGDDCEGDDPPAYCVGSPMPEWALLDYQPISCSYDQTYGLTDFRGHVTVFALWKGW